MKILNANNYKFVAQDKNGSICGFTEKPKDNHLDFWMDSLHSTSKQLITGRSNPNWKDTLIETKYFDAYLDENGYLIGIEKENEKDNDHRVTYELICNADPDRLSEGVNERLKEGWTLHGSLICSTTGVLIQTMIKSS